MGVALELISGLATAPGATLTAATALTGNSLTVRNAMRGIKMLARFDTRQGGGASRITSALLHDSTIGMQHSCPVGQATRLHTVPQRLYAQDLLGLQIAGSAVAGDVEHSSLLVAYDDLPGIEARFMSASAVRGRAVNLFENTITVASGTNGQYTGQVAVNSAQDAFKANTDYALLGYQVSGAQCHAVRFVGPDWGNLGIGGPGRIDDVGNSLTVNWFERFEMIPIMSSANKSLTLLDVAVDENGANPIVTMCWAELR